MGRFLMSAAAALVLFLAATTWLVLYPPIPGDLGGAENLQRSFQEVRIPVGRDDQVRAWLRRGGDRRLVVMFHGHGRDARRLSRYVPLFERRDASLLAVEFRSARPRNRKPTTIGHYERQDARAVLAWVRAQPGLRRARVVLFGESLGASVACAAAAADPRVAAVIADCPFATSDAALEDSFRHRLGIPVWPAAPLLRALLRVTTGHDPYGFDAARSLARVGDRPVLLIQSSRTDRFSARQVAALDAAAGPWVVRWTVPDAGHCQAWATHPREYERRVASFLGALGARGSAASLAMRGSGR